jgi:uncharacterized membrane protein
MGASDAFLKILRIYFAEKDQTITKITGIGLSLFFLLSMMKLLIFFLFYIQANQSLITIERSWLI